jgi:prepilin-type N-terminal cleavage/methylation domain-containing protein
MLTRLRADRDGVTLVELLVVMILLGAVGSIVTSAVVTGLRSAAATQARIEALHELEVALQRVSRDLRAAKVLTLSPDDAFGRDLGAELDRDGVALEVRYRVVDDVVSGVSELVREDTGQTLVTLVDNDGAEPVFRYLRATGEPVPCDTDEECRQAYLHAAQIEISLVRAIPGQGDIRAATRVSVRSIRYGS